jgi:hypothetical protein
MTFEPLNESFTRALRAENRAPRTVTIYTDVVNRSAIPSLKAAGADAFRDLWERRDIAAKSQRKTSVAVLSEPNT